jgi:Ca2+/Na+ antiporter
MELADGLGELSKGGDSIVRSAMWASDGSPKMERDRRVLDSLDGAMLVLLPLSTSVPDFSSSLVSMTDGLLKLFAGLTRFTRVLPPLTTTMS